MLQTASKQDVEYILSKAADSAKEGGPKDANISQEKAAGLTQMILSRGAYYLVHKENSKITGWILIGENVDYFTEQKSGFIFDVFVLPEHRGKGLSKVLINESIKEFKNKGYGEVRLNVYASNFAKEIYKKMGFEELNSIMYLKTSELDY